MRRLLLDPEGGLCLSSLSRSSSLSSALTRNWNWLEGREGRLGRAGSDYLAAISTNICRSIFIQVMGIKSIINNTECSRAIKGHWLTVTELWHCSGRDHTWHVTRWCNCSLRSDDAGYLNINIDLTRLRLPISQPLNSLKFKMLKTLSSSLPSPTGVINLSI